MNKKVLLGIVVAAVVVIGGYLFMQSKGSQELHIYAWADEVPQAILDDFSKETGIKVTLDTFDSNESLIAKLEAGAAGYDLIEPSQYAVQILEKKGLVEPLDHGKLPNLGNLSAVFQNISFDPGN